MVHDGAIPFRDNVDHAARIGTTMIIEPGGSTAAREVEQACTEHGITLVRTGRRLFLHPWSGPVADSSCTRPSALSSCTEPSTLSTCAAPAGLSIP
jgi:hypothetical protein